MMWRVIKIEICSSHYSQFFSLYYSNPSSIHIFPTVIIKTEPIYQKDQNTKSNSVNIMVVVIFDLNKE